MNGQLKKEMGMIVKPQRGAVLVAVIISIVILVIVGVAMYTMTTTSALNQAEAQKAARAYYLSESCLRIAAGEYKYARAISAQTAINTLVDLQGKRFNMPNNQGSCTIDLYPYWFYAKTATSCASGATSCDVILFLPGAVPMVEDGGTTSLKDVTQNVVLKLKKKGSNKPADVYKFSKVDFGSAFTSGSGTQAIITMSMPLTNTVTITAGEEFYLGAAYTLSTIPLTLNAGDNLVLKLDVADTTAFAGKIFPPVNGSIFLDIAGVPQVRYDKRSINISTSPITVTLTNIRAIGTTTLPITLSGNPDIYMGRSLGLKSEAEYGN